MSHQIKQIEIFIGHSDDVMEERKAAKLVIDSVNELLTVATIPYQFHGYWWGIEPPGGGPPQDKLNQRVEKCDIFLGILGLGWGNSNSKIEFSSGFHEEFDIAENGYKQKDMPDLWIYCKSIPESFKKDAGPKLLKNIEFRKYMKDNHACGYCKYKDISDFSKTLKDHLIIRASRLNQESLSYEKEDKSQANSQQITKDKAENITSSSIEKPVAVGNHDAIIEKLLETLPDFAKDNLTEDEIRFNRQFLSRLNLLSSFTLSQHYTGELLTAHQANLLYRDRTYLQLTPEEVKYLFRTIIGNEIAPGWYWVKDLTEDEITNLLFSYVSNDSDVNVRKGAINRLNDGRVPLNRAGNNWPNIIRKLIGDSDQGASEAGIKYIEKVGTKEDWQYIAEVLKECGIEFSDDAFRLEAMIRLKTDFENAMELILENMTKLPDVILAKLNEIKSKININYLNRAIYHTDDNFAIFAITELISRGKFDIEDCKNLVKFPSNVVKFICLEHLIKEGVVTEIEEFNEYTPKGTAKLLLSSLGFSVKKLIEMIFSKYSIKKLKKRIDWISVESEVAYKLLYYKNFDSLSTELRKDLDNEFINLRIYYTKHLKSNMMKKTESKFPPDMDKKKRLELLKVADLAIDKSITENILTNDSDAVMDYAQSKHISAALSVLAEKGIKEDKKYGIKYLYHSSEDIQEQAFIILKRFGNDLDTKDLIRFAKESSGSIKIQAAQTALKLSSDKLETAKSLIKTGDSILASEAMIFIQENNIINGDDLIKPLLHLSNNTIRRDAFVFFAGTKSKDELKTVLEEYLSSGKYYYNVVCWLDRKIYAPEFLMERYHFRYGDISKSCWIG